MPWSKAVNDTSPGGKGKPAALWVPARHESPHVPGQVHGEATSVRDQLPSPIQRR